MSCVSSLIEIYHHQPSLQTQLFINSRLLWFASSPGWFLGPSLPGKYQVHLVWGWWDVSFCLAFKSQTRRTLEISSLLDKGILKQLNSACMCVCVCVCDRNYWEVGFQGFYISFMCTHTSHINTQIYLWRNRIWGEKTLSKTHANNQIKYFSFIEH